MTYGELTKEIRQRPITQFPGIVQVIISHCANKPVFKDKAAMLRFVERAWELANPTITKAPAALSPLVPIDPYVIRDGETCGLCDGTYAHEHPMMKCTICDQSGLSENMERHVCHPSHGVSTV